MGLHNEDKMYHLLGFAPLAYFYWRFFETFGPRSARFVYGAALVLAAYAAVDEYTQVYFDRGREFADWATGVGAMWLVLGVLEWQRRRRLRTSTR